MPVNFKNPDFRMSGKTAEQDYYTDENGEITDDPARQRFLLIRAGQEMTTDVAEKVGKVAQGADAEDGEKSAEAPANKARKSAKADKGAK